MGRKNQEAPGELGNVPASLIPRGKFKMCWWHVRGKWCIAERIQSPLPRADTAAPTAPIFYSREGCSKTSHALTSLRV